MLCLNSKYMEKLLAVPVYRLKTQRYYIIDIFFSVAV